MNLRWIVALYFLPEVVYCGMRNCCQGNNTIQSKKCINGSLNDVLGCPNRYLIRSKDVDEINESEGTLKYGVAYVYSDSFCRARLNNSDVFIVCHDPEDFEEPSNIFVILGFISAVFLFLTIAIYLSLPKLLDLQGKCIIHSILGLACAFVIMGINQLSDLLTNFVCHIYAYSLYFSFLYAFFWLNTYSFHLWRTTIQPKIFANVKRWEVIYYIYSCGCPILLLSLVFFSQFSKSFYIFIHPRMAEESICWFGTLEASFLYLYVPISILLSLNVIYFFWTIYGLWKEIHKYDGKKMKILKYRLSLCVKMFFVMGISWIFEVLSAAFEHKYPSFLWDMFCNLSNYTPNELYRHDAVFVLWAGLGVLTSLVRFIAREVGDILKEDANLFYLTGSLKYRWISGFLPIFPRISDTINALQGVLIFFVMVVCRKRVYRLMADKPYGKMLPPTWRSVAEDEDVECTETEDDYKLDQVNAS